MKKRYDIKLGIEDDTSGVELEVDKEANMTTDEKATRDLAEASEAKDKAAQTDDTSTTPGNPDEASQTNPVEGTDTPAKLTDESELETQNAPEGSVDVDSQEGQDQVAEKNDVAESVDIAIETATALEAIAAVVLRSLDVGGLTPLGARTTNVALESMYARVGIEMKSTKYPALESFDSVSARRMQTKLALESIGENIGRIWKAVVAGMGRLVSRLKNLLGNIMFSLKSQKEKIKALRAIYPKLKREEPLYSTYKNKRFISDLCLGSTFSPTDALQEAHALWHTSRTVTLPEAVKIFSSAAATKAYVYDIGKVLPSGSTHKSNDSMTMSYVNSKPMPGGFEIHVTLPKSGLQGAEHTAAITQTNYFTDVADAFPPEQVNILKKDELMTTITHLESLHQELWMGASVVDNTFDRYLSLADEFSNSLGINVAATVAATLVAGPVGAAIGYAIADKIQTSNQSQTQKEMIILIRNSGKLFLDLPFELYSLGEKTLSAGVAYCNTSARAYV